MKPTTILQALTDDRLFGRHFKDPTTWQAWRVFLGALFGIALNETERRLFRKCTGRQHPQDDGYREAWLCIGRRGGKSFVLALIAVYLACFKNWRSYLGPGERGTIMVIAADRRQARVIMRYVVGLVKSTPVLCSLIESERAEGLELANRVVVEVHTASFKTTRGYTLIAALCDEIAFWPTEDSAEPDVEILAALRPGMATIPGALLLCASSPYARRGALWDAYHKHFAKDDPILVWQAPTRRMNPTVPQSVIDQAMERDPASANAEYMAEFRIDIESFISREAIAACVADGIYERSPQSNLRYAAFVDPSGGSSDSMTLAIAHRDPDQVFLDAIRELRPPFSPEAVVAEFAATLKSYGISKVTGDRYAGEWPREQFRKYGISYEVSQKAKSDLYRDLLPLLNSRRVELLDQARLIGQLAGLERRTARSGKDSIDHAPGGHDDLANAAAGALLAAHAAHKQRIRMGFLAPDYAPLYGPVQHGYEVDPVTLERLDRPRTRIRFVRLTEQEAPAVRGVVHGKWG